MNQFGSAANSGRSTPVVTSGRTTPTALIGAVSEVGGTNVVNTNIANTNVTNNNIAKFGREMGSKAYSAEEHRALLSVLQSTPNSFNSGEGCDEWKAVYREMVNCYYLPNKRDARLSSTLHAHFVELYSAFKLGIRTLSQLPNAPKCPTSVTADNQDDCELYIQTLHTLLISDKRKFQSPKWWSFEVVNLLLVLHLEYLKGYGSDNQNVEWLISKAEKAKGKFDTDQKNREAEIARKRKIEEEEAKEAAQNRKVVAESSAKMCKTLEGSMQIFEGIAQKNFIFP